MKKIIEGKKYDTETAIEIAMNEVFDDSISRWQVEKLYRKKTGEFFIFHDKTTTWGNIYAYTKIEPIHENEAREWIEAYANNKYEELFGIVEE